MNIEASCNNSVDPSEVNHSGCLFAIQVALPIFSWAVWHETLVAVRLVLHQTAGYRTPSAILTHSNTHCCIIQHLKSASGICLWHDASSIQVYGYLMWFELNGMSKRPQRNCLKYCPMSCWLIQPNSAVQWIRLKTSSRHALFRVPQVYDLQPNGLGFPTGAKHLDFRETF